VLNLASLLLCRRQERLKLAHGRSTRCEEPISRTTAFAVREGSATADWNGLITPISVTGADIAYVRVVAIDSHGDVLGQTDTIPTS
jgi:hypothetical protein